MNDLSTPAYLRKSSIRTVKKGLLSHVLTTFHLPPTISAGLHRYYILHWSGSYLLSARNLRGFVEHQGIEYAIIWHECSERDLVSFPRAQVAVSFRKLRGIDLGYAMVKLLSR